MQNFILILFCLLAGCQTTKWVDRPFLYAPSRSSDIWIPPKNEKVMLDILPLSQQGPLSLAALLDIGLLNSPLTQKTWAEARAAAATYTQSMSLDFPQLDITAFSTRSRTSFYEGTSALAIYYQTETWPQMTLSYILLDFGERQAITASAREALYNANWTHNSQMQTLIETISLDYYSYLYQLEQLRANEADLEDARTSFDAAKEKFDRGVADVSDVLQAKSQLLQQQINLTNQKMSTEHAFVQLAADVGLPANKNFSVLTFPKDLGTLNLDDIDHLLEIASSHRPDLFAAMADVRSKEASVQAAKAKLYPTITANAAIGRTYYGTLNDDYDFSLGLTLNYPIFHGFNLKNGVRIAEANLEASKASLEEIKLTVISDVTRFRSDLHFAYENLHYAEDYLKAAEEEFKVTLKQYKVRINTILDVLNAQATLADARAKRAQSYQDWFDALAKMAYGTGTLYAPGER